MRQIHEAGLLYGLDHHSLLLAWFHPHAFNTYNMEAFTLDRNCCAMELPLAYTFPKASAVVHMRDLLLFT